MENFKDYLIKECEKNNGNCEYLFDYFCDKYYYKKPIWQDNEIDEHRWYDVRWVVVELNDGRFIKFSKYSIKSESMELGDIIINYDDFLTNDVKFVEKKERIIKEIYYES